MEVFTVKLVCFLLVLLVIRVKCLMPKPPRTVSEYHSRFKERAEARLLDAVNDGRVEKRGSVFYLTEYGADPTGTNDSSDAIMRAINDAFEVESPRELLTGIKDLGGVQIDLQGGNFMISKPLRFPSSGGGNLAIHSGTLRASEDFPADRFLIELWSEHSTRLPPAASTTAANYEAKQIMNEEGDYYEDVTLRDLALDSTYRGGGILAVNSVRTKIINCFIFHFATDGILVERGHETYISSTFIGQHITVGSDPGEGNFSGIGIDLAGNDNAITDVAIFSSATGVMLRGQANILTGVHCYNKATGFGGVGIYVKLPGLTQTRIDNSYLDWNGIVTEDPVQLHVTNTFFLGDGNIKIKSVNGQISELNIVDNMFSGNNNGVPIVVLDESNGPFNSIDQVIIDRNNVRWMAYRSTVGKLTVAGEGTKWVADFSNVLVFPNRITHVQYSMVARGNSTFSLHAVRSVGNNSVVVESKKVMDGVVSVVVDQNLMLGEKSALV